MNEATLEARLNKEIDRLFPTLDKLKITHQNSFNLRLGHNHITVNGFEKAIAGGRLDVLISYKEKNLAIIELKAPNIMLNRKDVEQGISYARLSNPMPPIVIITNGEETQFYNTFDMKQWFAEEINEKTIQDLFCRGIALAKEEHDQAIKTLLGQQPDLWKKIFIDYTKKELEEFEGSIDDFSYPISNKFIIERTVVGDILECCLKNPVVNFVGNPLSGKTSVAYQICHNSSYNIVPFYIDSSTNYGILRKISNKFSADLFKQMTPEDVRHWLINSLKSHTDERILLIVDNLSSTDDSEKWKEIYELIDINENNSFSILLVMNNFLFNHVSTYSGRSTKTKIGKAPVIKLLPLSDDEFIMTCNQLFKESGIQFHKGSKYNVEYRNPRLLRILFSQLIGFKTMEKIKDNINLYIPSITTFDILRNLWDEYVTNIETQSDLRYFVEAVLNENDLRINDPILSILSTGTGIVTLRTAEAVLGDKRIERLMKSGLIQQFNLSGGKSYLCCKFPEALSVAAACYITEKIVALSLSNNFTEAYNYLLKTVLLFPYSDLVATMAIIESNKKDFNILSNMIFMLLDDEPKIEAPPKKGKYLAYFEDIGEINMDGELDGILMSNLHPWLILSHIASIPLSDEDGNRNIQLHILSRVGAFNNILIRIDNVPFKDMTGYHVHDNPDGTSFICGKLGIIEPITFAIQRGFYDMPESMVELCNYAVEKNNLSLLMRLNIAARSTVGCSDATVHTCAQRVESITSNEIHSLR